ncbi:hypothetical protein HpBT101_00140 [Helicobacter pylori]
MAWLMEYSNPTLAYAPFSSAIQKDKNKDENKDKENKVFCMGDPIKNNLNHTLILIEKSETIFKPFLNTISVFYF